MLKVQIEGSEIVLRLPLETLKHCTDHHPELEGEVAITHLAKFAEDVVLALEEEEEDGTTVLMKSIDIAIVKAVENGSEGCEERGRAADRDED